MNIKQLIKEAHDNAVERGFYPEGEDRNIGELLMLIVSELGEALEAHRCGRCADWDLYERDVKDHTCLNKSKHQFQKARIVSFMDNIKDTFDDEIADVFIRLFDLCGYLKIDAYFEEMEIYTDNIGEMLLGVVKEITNYNFCNDKKIWMAFVLSSLDGICQKLNIPIEKHIKAKMAYNRTRPRKHGKEY